MASAALPAPRISSTTPYAQANQALANTEEQRDKAQKQSATLKQELKGVAREAASAGIVVGSAFTCGYLSGRYGDNSEVFGMPLGGTVAVGGLAAVGFKVGGKSARPYLISIATGGAAAIAASIGQEMGKEDAEAPVAGIGAGRSSRRLRKARREEEDEIPADLPPGLRAMYERRKREEHLRRL